MGGDFFPCAPVEWGYLCSSSTCCDLLPPSFTLPNAKNSTYLQVWSHVDQTQGAQQEGAHTLAELEEHRDFFRALGHAEGHTIIDFLVAVGLAGWR